MSINHCCVLYNFHQKSSKNWTENFFYSNIGQSFSRNEFFIILSIKLFFPHHFCLPVRRWKMHEHLFDILIDRNYVRFTIIVNIFVERSTMNVCAWILRAHCLIMDIVMICLFHCCSLVEFDGTNKKYKLFIVMCRMVVECWCIHFQCRIIFCFFGYVY